MKLGTIFSSLLLAIPLYISAGIPGIYEAHGYSETTHTPYIAEVAIIKTGELYLFTWTYPDSSFETGTGVRKDDSIAVVWKEGGLDDYGVQLYEIEGSHLKGPWAYFDQSSEGFERLRKLDLDSSHSHSSSDAHSDSHASFNAHSDSHSSSDAHSDSHSSSDAHSDSHSHSSSGSNVNT